MVRLDMRARIVVSLSFAAITATTARAQCADWATGFEVPGVVGYTWVEGGGFQPAPGEVLASAIFDDGSGPALYVAGRFNRVGSIAVNSIAKWNGTSWADVGGGVSEVGAVTIVYALAVYDDGTGPALFVGGEFDDEATVNDGFLRRWDGSSWTTIGGIGRVRSMEVFDDGSGSALYVGGEFTNAGGVPDATDLARWNGSAWSAVGAPGITTDWPGVTALAVYDDGTGPALYVGADGLIIVGGQGFQHSIGKWDGTSWSNINVQSDALAMAVYDDGDGHPSLYFANSDSVKKWDGRDTSFLPNPPYWPTALGVFIDPSGGGRKLYVGGRYMEQFGVVRPNVAAWDGDSWTTIGAPLVSNVVRTFAKWNGDIYAGGGFSAAGGEALNGLGRWDGVEWSAIGGGDGVDSSARAFAIHDDGTGPKLLVAGTLRTAGDVDLSSGGLSLSTSRGVAQWNGSGWSAFAAGLFGPIHALASYDDGTGADVYAATTSNVFRWNGVAWSSLPGSPTGGTTQLVVFDAPGAVGPRLIMTGPEESLVKQWDGTTMSALGLTNGDVEALAVYDDGSGPKLVIGGPFTSVDGVGAIGIARFDGSTWSAIGAGAGWPVTALEVFHDGSAAPASLFAAVQVTTSFLPLTVHAALLRWNGSAWSTIGVTETVIGTSSRAPRIYDLAVHGTGTSEGQALYVGGEFQTIGGVAAQNLARWSGSAWSAVNGGAENVVRALCAFGDGTDAAADLWIGGDFNEVGGVPSRSIAKLQGCEGVGEPFCFADGTLANDCPCAAPSTVPNPQGSAFGGCASAFNPHGASLTGIGTTNPDTVTLHASGMSPSGFTMFIRGDAAVAGGLASHDGLRCTGGALVRFGGQVAVAGRAVYPNPSLGYTLPLSFVSGVTPGSGVTNHYQPFYRNVTPGFCSAGTINYTNGYSVKWD